MDMLNSFVALTFQLSVPIVLGALCGTIAERGGIILLGVEEDRARRFRRGGAGLVHRRALVGALCRWLWAF